jgi:hypothetical protein
VQRPATSGQKEQNLFSKILELPKLENPFNGTKIQGYREDQAESEVLLDSIMKREFQRCFQQWERS